MSKVSNLPLIVTEYHNFLQQSLLLGSHCWHWNTYFLIFCPCVHWEVKTSHLPAPYQISCVQLHLVHSCLTCSRLRSKHQGLLTVCCVCRGLCYVRGFVSLCRGWKDHPKTKSSNPQSLSYFPFFCPLIWAMRDPNVLYFDFRWSQITVLFKALACGKTKQFKWDFKPLLATHKSCAASH